MGETTAIEWTDATFNPWIGCAHVHAGCTHCYAESFAKRYDKATWGPNGTRVKTSDAYWRKPLKWNREAERDGLRRRVFCASLADVFEDWDNSIRDARGMVLHSCYSCGRRCALPSDECDVGERAKHWCECGQPINNPCMWLTMADLRRDLFALIDQTPWLDWLLLTKRPQNVRRMITPWLRNRMGDGRESPDGAWRQGVPIRNLWLGTSISDQPTAEAMLPELLKCRDLCPVLFVSAEPLLGPVDLMRCGAVSQGESEFDWEPLIDWLIVGGESGHGARPCDVAWVRSIRDQCEAAGTACFVKQLGRHPYNGATNEALFFDDGKGGDWAEWPADLRVRQFPERVPQPHGGSHQ